MLPKQFTSIIMLHIRIFHVASKYLNTSGVHTNVLVDLCESKIFLLEPRLFHNNLMAFTLFVIS